MGKKEKAPAKTQVTPQPPIEKFADEAPAYDAMRGVEIRFDAETEPGTAFQGICLGSFVNPNTQTGQESRGYKFIDRNGQSATVWGSYVLDRLMPQYTPPVFLTITFRGIKGRTKTFDVVSSEAGLKKYAALLKGIDMSKFEWFEEIPV